MASLKYIDCPNYYAVYFRKTTKQLDSSLWPEAKELYLPFLRNPKTGKWIGKARIQEQKHRIIFPSGATLDFSYLENDKDVVYNWQGAQLTAAFLDEATHFSQFQFNYLRTRLRSKSKYSSFIACSCNPDNSSFVYDWVEPYLDEEGYPDNNLSCKVRYFVMSDGIIHGSWEKEDIKNRFPHLTPREYVFIPSKLTDNKIMLANNEFYAEDLAANNPAEKAALLDGCWKYQGNEALYFERTWLEKVDKVPDDAVSCRAYDKAGKAPDEKNRFPDFTAASPRVWKDKQGIYYLTGDFIPEFKDKESDVVGKFRKQPGERDTLIEQQANHDGSDCVVVLAQDGGQAGLSEYLNAASKLISEGIRVEKDPAPQNAKKLKRFEPFSSACQNGLVKIVESSFPNRETLESFYKELEYFDGERSSSKKKDDWPDATASAFNYISQKKVVPTISVPNFTQSNPFNIWES